MGDFTIAVLSDFHCHTRKQKPHDIASYLVVEDLKNPTIENPAKALQHLIAQKQIKADILIMPGDFSNAIGENIDEEGFATAWELTKQIGKSLGVKDIISTLGNHDVESRNSTGKDPFAIAKKIGEDFPINDKNANLEFWKEGFTVRDLKNVRVLVINSAYDHDTKERSQRGNISIDQLTSLENKLELLKKTKKETQIAICHHHPISHPGNDYKLDLMIRGVELISLLEKYGFGLLIHGHKHNPLLSQTPTGGNSAMTIFSSGSFSRILTHGLRDVSNTFHLITLPEEIIPNCSFPGIVKTWRFIPYNKWIEKLDEKLPPLSGFGYRGLVKHLVDRTKTWLETREKRIALWEDLIEEIPEIKHLLPADANAFLEQCKVASIGIDFNITKRYKIDRIQIID